MRLRCLTPSQQLVLATYLCQWINASILSSSVQSIKHNRRPYDCEITEEVAREYSRQQEDRRLTAMEPGRGFPGMTSRVTTVEGSVARLEQKIERQHSRLEGLLRELLGTPAVQSMSVLQQIPVSPTPLPETSMAAAVRAALASEPCVRVSLKDNDVVDISQDDAGKIPNVPFDVNGTYQEANNAENTDAVPMDVEGVTDCVENVVSSVGGTQAGDDHVQTETDAYDLEVVTVTDTPVEKVAEKENQVSSTSLFPKCSEDLRP